MAPTRQEEAWVTGQERQHRGEAAEEAESQRPSQAQVLSKEPLLTRPPLPAPGQG